MHVAICGGGIGGLVLAQALSEHNQFEVSVYEAASEFSGKGTGFGIWRRTWLILKELGFGDALNKLVEPMSSEPVFTCRFRKSDHSCGESLENLFAKGGMRGAHRGEFHKMLLSVLRMRANVSMHNSKRLLHYREVADGETVCLYFEDGSTASCNVLVGADGLRSAVRSTMVSLLQKSDQEIIHPPGELCIVKNGVEVKEMIDKAVYGSSLDAYHGAIWDGFLVYRTIISRFDLEATAPDHGALSSPLTFYMGQDCNIVVFPIERNTAFNIAIYTFDPQGSDAKSPYPGKIETTANTAGILRKIGNSWEPEVLQLLSCISSPELRQWSVNEVEELPTYSHNRVVLIGDAAHAIMPSLGMGAGQAIEDAYILAALLTHPKAHADPRGALEVFSRVRLPFVRSVARLSWTVGLQYVFRDVRIEIMKFNSDENSSENGYLGRNESITPRELGRRLVRSFEWTGQSASSIRALATRLFESGEACTFLRGAMVLSDRQVN